MSVRQDSDGVGSSVRGLVDTVGELLDSLTQGSLSEQSRSRLGSTAMRFGLYLERGAGLDSLTNISPADVEGFVHAPVAGPTGPQRPTVATMHFRRSAVRLLLRLARAGGLLVGDPTLDLLLPRRSPGSPRALTDDEVISCRNAALRTLVETRQPAAWALAEATARTGEIGWIRASDVDLDGGRVWIHGQSRTETRWGDLSEWGVRQLRRRLRTLTRNSRGTFLAHEGAGSPQSRQASACRAITDVLARAGLGGDPDVRPLSIPAWVGAKLRAEGDPIEEIARRLGMRSLDRTARLIGLDREED
jgi:integrase